MIREEVYNSFVEYLTSKNIKLIEQPSKEELIKLRNVDESIAEIQLFTMSEFHKRVMGYKVYMGKRLDNKTGSVIEQYKVNIKRLQRYLKNIRINSASSDFERILLKVGFEQLQRSEKCISEMYNAGYISIIERSMKRIEICLGDVDYTNLIKEEESLEILNIDKCCYNNVEMDCFNLLSKYRRKGIELDYKKLVYKFCEFEGLEDNSAKFILALLSYPHAFMKCCNRYREKSKEWSEKEYEDRLDKAILKDGEPLLL